MRGFSRAMISNLQGGDVQGASTLTQQFVKITLQENALKKGDKERRAGRRRRKTYSRKLQELKYALNVEENFTKDQILEGYLNLVYYGDQAYGVEAASLNYFGVSASKLTLVPGRPAGRRRAAAHGLQPGAEPEGGRGPAQRRARPDAVARPGHRQGRHRGQEGRRSRR